MGNEIMTVDEFNKLGLKIRNKKRFIEWMQKEDHIQHQIVTWLEVAHPSIKFHHSPDAGERSPFEQFKYAFLGGKKDFPDLQIPQLKIIMEIKIPGKNPTSGQQAWLDIFKGMGWVAVCVRSFDEGERVIRTEINKLILK